jgi:1-pyrroline-5-carboxylate dehydrogenase
MLPCSALRASRCSGSVRQARLASTSSAPWLDLASWATVDPDSDALMTCMNRVDGQWAGAARTATIPDPLTGRALQAHPDTQIDELGPFLKSLAACPKSGLHNPLKRPERYLQYGEVSHRMAQAMSDPAVEHFFTRLIQRVMPKSYKQCLGEVAVTRTFLKSFSGDSLRFLAGRGSCVSGDHAGQFSAGYRWPFGPVVVVAPFNFPLEIPALQTMAALFAGNKVLVKPSEKVGVVMDQFARLMLACRGPGVLAGDREHDDLLILHGAGAVAERVCT